MMTDDYFENWVTSVRATLAEMASMDWGYPIGTNDVRERSAERHVVPPSLEPLYAICDGASLMNVYVGYDIHPSWMVEAAAQRFPTRIKGKVPRAIHVFGSDGGGSMFALGIDDGAVYYLFNEALIEDGVYEEDEDNVPVRRVAGSVVEFLERLKADIEAFVRGDEDYRYMVSLPTS